MTELNTLLIVIFNWFISPAVLPHLAALIIGVCFGIYVVAIGFQRSRFTQHAEGLFTGLLIGAVAWALYQGPGMSELASLPATLKAIVMLLNAALALLSFGLAAAVTGLVALIVWGITAMVRSLVRRSLPEMGIN